MENKQTRKLAGFLFLSGLMNIVFVSHFFYSIMRERPPIPYFEQKPANLKEQQTPFAIDHSNQEMIRRFKMESQEVLIAKLSDTEYVENGYRVCDLSLACLVAFHHFDLSRALLDDEQPRQIRYISYSLKRDGKPSKVPVYAGLSDKQFKSIIEFAKRERFPMTPKGLFLNLKTPKGRENLFLVDAFYLTPEFASVATLFSRSDVRVEKQEILNVLLDGSFSMLSQFAEQQKQSQDLSSARRQYFLLEYIKHQSRFAAYLLLKTDGPQIVRKFDDAHIKMILSLLKDKTKDSCKFALTCLTSPRGDSVWELAAKRLYEYAGEVFPEKFDHGTALSKFLPDYIGFKPHPKPHSELPLKLKEELPRTFYIVQEGDSLWKISRKFDIDIDLLKKHNALSSDVLKPGTSLSIP